MKRIRTIRGWRTVLTLACTIVLAAPAGALAYVAHDGAAASDFATGFPTESDIGPIGLAFDPTGSLYVAGRSHLYRFGPQGGQADGSTQVDQGPGPGPLAGLAFGTDGRLYAARYTSAREGEVVELDPETGTILQTVAGPIPCPAGLATDPVNGDLYVSELACGSTILRIQRPGSGAAAVSPFVHAVADGITFGPDGTLYIAHQSPSPDGATISSYDPSGRRTDIAAVPTADGVALGAPAQAGGPPPFLIVDRNDGTVTHVDLTGSHAQTDLVTGGTRGDFVAVGPDRCLYATQSSSILKITNADGSCASAGAAGPLGGGLLPTSVRSVVRCRTRSVTVPLRFRGRRLRGMRLARVYVGRRAVRTVRGRGLRGSVILRRLPAGAFTVSVRAVPRRGRSYVSYVRRYPACGRRLRDRMTTKKQVHALRHPRRHRTRRRR